MAALVGASLVGVACADYVFAPGERAVRGIQLTPTQVTINEGQSATISATLLDQLDSAFASLPTGVSLRWSSANPAVATIDGTGKVTGDSTGATQVTADVSGDFGRFSATAGVTVLPNASVVTVSITPASPTVASGATVLLTATARDSVGNPLAVPMTWVSGTSTVASVDSTGLVTGHLVGAAIITASAGGKSGTDSVTVVPGPASPTTSVVRVAAPTVPAGDSITLTLTTRDSAGNLRSTGGDTVTFTTSGGTSTGTVGAVTDHADGTYTAFFRGLSSGTPTTVGAKIRGQAVTTALPTVQVTPGTDTLVATVAITPRPVTVASGATQPLTTTVKNSLGTVLSGKPTVWTSSLPGVAKVDSTGLVTGDTAGKTVVTATVQGVSGVDTVTVVPGAPSRLTSIVTAAPESIAVGDSSLFTLGTKDAAGNALTTGGHSVQFGATGGSSAGTVRPVVDHGDGTYTAEFVGTTAGTALTVRAGIDAAPPVVSTSVVVVTSSGSTHFVHWANPAGGAWTTPANWSPAQVPTAQDTAVIDAPGSYLVTNSGSNVGGLVVGATGGPGGAHVLFNGPAEIPGAVVIHAGDTLDVDAAVLVGSFLNSGVILLEDNGGGETNVVLAIDTIGLRTAVNNGTIDGANGGVLNVTKATGLVNHGTLSPGIGTAAVGQMAIAGNVTLGTGSVVSIDLTGAGSSQQDALGITGTAVLGDTLRVQLQNGYVPNRGDALGPVVWSAFSGTFGTLQLPPLPAGLQWQVSYTPVGLVLTVVGPSVSAYLGDGQSAPAGASVSVPPAVRLLDAASNPIVGASVTFAVTSGGGSLTDPTTVTTDASGIAQVGGWTLGAPPGTNTISATVALPGISGNPVTFTATGTATGKTWTGAVSSDWSVPLNWSPIGAPTSVDAVSIGPAANEPLLTGPAVASTVTISGPGAVLTIGGQTLTTGALTTVSGGLLVMTNPSDLVIVAGPAFFAGGNETGSLTAGELRVAGDFNQGGGGDPAAFSASGTHRTVFNGAALQSVQFVNVPGSAFQDLDISHTVGINIQFDFNGVTVHGALISQPGVGPIPLLYGLGRSITAGQLVINGLTVQASSLTAVEGSTPLAQQVDNVTFQDPGPNPFYPAHSQLGLSVIGASPRTLTFNNVTFVPLTTGDTGHYLVINAPSGSVVVNLVGTNVTDGPTFTQTTGAVTVNWP